MAIARANGKLKGKPPKLSARQHAHLLKLLETGEHTIAEIAERLSVSRATVYRESARASNATPGAIAEPSPRYRPREMQSSRFAMDTGSGFAGDASEAGAACDDRYMSRDGSASGKLLALVAAFAVALDG